MFLLAFMVILLIASIEYCIFYGLIWAICFGFGLAFSWKMVLGVWASWILIYCLFGGGSKKE